MHDTVNYGGNCPAEAGEFDSSCRERSAPSCGGFAGVPGRQRPAVGRDEVTGPNGSCDDVIALFKAA